jgi:hypothetical protein
MRICGRTDEIRPPDEPCPYAKHGGEDNRPKGGQLSLREVSKELAASGFLNGRKVHCEHVELAALGARSRGRGVGKIWGWGVASTF